MSLLHRTRLARAALLGSVATGCSLVAGLGSDYTTAPDAGDDTTLSEAGDGTAGDTIVGLDVVGFDTPPNDADAASAPDVPSDTPCDSQATENCTNGIDDNCNGLVDCADPACTSQGFACTAGVVPPGWTVVAYDRTSRSNCATGYGPAVNVIANPAAAPDSCACVCTGTSACSGTVAFYKAGAGCTGAVMTTYGSSSGLCGSTNIALSTANTYYITATPATPECSVPTEPGTVTGSPTVTEDTGDTCAAAGPLGAGCGGGQCAPPVGAGYALCISHPTKSVCPPGYGTTIDVSTDTPGYVDTRGCSPCSCGSGFTCFAPKGLQFYSKPSCMGSLYEVTGTCLAPTTSFLGASYEIDFSMSGSPACTPGTSTPTGNVTLDAQVTTICCR